MTVHSLRTDVLVIGGGLAAAEAAIAASKYGVQVLLVDKGRFGSSGASATAGGNPQAYVPAGLGGHPDDSPEVLFRDIVAGGGFLSVQPIAKIVAEEIADRVREADTFGVPYLKDAEGKFYSFKTMGTSYPRVGPVRNWGIGMMQALRKEALHRGVRCLERVQVVRLLQRDGTVIGAVAVDMESGNRYLCSAASVVLACGSALELYPYSSASYTTTGDAYSLAFEAGAELANMEFVEFTLIPAPGGVPLPTGGIKPTLSSGGRFYNARDERFLRSYDPQRMENTTRSTLIRAVHGEIEAGRGPCRIDTSTVPEPSTELERFKFLALRKLVSLGIDIKNEPVPWIPAVHTFLGGARINDHCETTVAGLYAAGEAAGHGGLFGADRGGSSIAACMVLGARAGTYAARRSLEHTVRSLSQGEINQSVNRPGLSPHGGGLEPRTAKLEIQRLAHSELFISRSRRGLQQAVDRFAELRVLPAAEEGAFHSATEVRNLALTGELVARAALARRESRGQHTRADYPEGDDRSWLAQVVLLKEGDGRTIGVRTEPIPIQEYPLQPEGRRSRGER
jgi:fumarate reductase (CoM/CoB) subunit A